MKNIKTILKTIILAVALLTINPVPTMAQDLKATKDYYTNSGSFITEFNDNSFSCINTENKKYEFTLDTLGDWDITADSEQELNNIVDIYKSHADNSSDLCNTIKNIKETDRYTDNETGLTTIEYNNGSFALYNETANLYQFTPAETLVTSQEGYCVSCDNMQQLNNCIATYISIKGTGMY